MSKSTKTTKAMQAVSYSRYSPRPNADSSESIDFQRDACREFCRKRGWEVVGEYNDVAMSGSDHGRTGLWEAVGATKRGMVLIVHKLDRLARDAALFWLIESELTHRKARIISICGEGTENTSPDSKMIRGIVAVIAAYQREMMNARTSSMMQAYSNRGRRMSRHAPYGWELDPESPLVVRKTQRDNPAEQQQLVRSGWRRCEHEQQVLARVIQLRELDYSAQKISDILSSEGIPPRDGVWNHMKIRWMLRTLKGTPALEPEIVFS